MLPQQPQTNDVANSRDKLARPGEANYYVQNLRKEPGNRSRKNHIVFLQVPDIEAFRILCSYSAAGRCCLWRMCGAAAGELLGLGSEDGNFGLHVCTHVTPLTLANRNPFLGPPRKPTNWCLLEKF